MLTPKHRALFAAAYSSQLLRSPRDERETGEASPQTLDTPSSSTAEQQGAGRPQDNNRPTAA